MDTTRDPLEHFAYELLRAADLDALPEDAKAEFVVRLRDEAQRRIGIIAMENLDEQGMTEFTAMIEQAPPPEPVAVQTFLIGKIPDFETKMQAGLLAFADEFVKGAQTKQEA